MSRTKTTALADADFLTPPWRQGFALVTMMLLVYVSFEAWRPNPSAVGNLHVDKLLHFGAFFCLALTGGAACRPGHPSLTVLTGALLTYGAVIELVQGQIPGREASWADLGADLLGIVAGLWVLTLLGRWWARRRKIL